MTVCLASPKREMWDASWLKADEIQCRAETARTLLELGGQVR